MGDKKNVAELLTFGPKPAYSKYKTWPDPEDLCVLVLRHGATQLEQSNFVVAHRRLKRDIRTIQDELTYQRMQTIGHKKRDELTKRIERVGQSVYTFVVGSGEHRKEYLGVRHTAPVAVLAEAAAITQIISIAKVLDRKDYVSRCAQVAKLKWDPLPIKQRRRILQEHGLSMFPPEGAMPSNLWDHFGIR